jgi:PAS domain S-box-containing protein
MQPRAEPERQPEFQHSVKRDALEGGRLRLALDSIPALLHSAEPDGSLDYFNQRWLDYLGVELDDINGWGWISKVHPEDADVFVEKWRYSLRIGKPLEAEARVLRNDGVYRWMLHRKVPLRDKQGKIIKWYGSSIDIDDRKRSEFYLAEGQRLGHAGSWSFKPDLTCDYWSRELYEILGFDPRNGIPTISDYLTRIHPLDRQVVEATIQRMVAAGEGCDLKKRIIRPDGVQRVIRCVGMAVRENGAVTRFVGTLMDITEQEQLTQELRRREAYLAEAQRLSHTGSFGWNYGATGELTWSEETYRICGFDSSIKPTHQLVRDRVHPDDLQVWQQAFDQAVEGEEVDFEHRLLMPDGSVKHLHVVAYGVQKDGKFVELVGTLRDVTEQKQIEDRLRRSERNLAEGQRLTKTGSWILDYKTGNTDWSDETCRIFGFPDPPPSPHYSEFLARVRPEDRESVDRALGESFKTGEPRPLEYIFVLPNGVRKNIETISQPVRDKTGTVVRLMGTVMDVTERKQAQEAIRRSEAFLAEGQRLSHTGSWGWNASTGKLTWSQEHFRILGLDPQTTNPSLDVFWERVHPDDRIGLRRAFESAIQDKRNFEREFRIVTPDWSIRHLHGVGHAVLNKANELLEFIGSTMDITERKRTEEWSQRQREASRLALNAFVEGLDVNRFLGDLIAEFNKQFHASTWALWLYDETPGELFRHLSSHSSGSQGRGVGDGNTPRIEEVPFLRQAKSIVRVPQVFELPAQGSKLGSQYFESLTAQGIKTLLIVPLVIGEQNLGFLEMHFLSQIQLTSYDIDLAQAMGNRTTLVLQLNRLTRRAEQLAVTEERNRLAREIHDTLAQSFAGIVLHSEVLGASLAVSRQRSAKALSQIQKLARSGLEEARRSVQALRPKALDGATLPEALRQAAIRLNDDAKLSCQFRQRGKNIHLSEATQNELFRIGQEALTNVVKHAQARSVCVTLVSQARRVTLSIKDDGVGFTTAKPQNQSHGFGMGTMRERAQGIGGRLRVESRPGRGTTIRVEVPSPAGRSKKKVNQ